jgi:hypothetical protein
VCHTVPLRETIPEATSPSRCMTSKNTDRQMVEYTVHADINLVATILFVREKGPLHEQELFWTLILLAGSLTLGRTLTSSRAYIAEQQLPK